MPDRDEGQVKVGVKMPDRDERQVKVGVKMPDRDERQVKVGVKMPDRDERQVKVGVKMPDRDERQVKRELEVREQLAGEEEDALLRFSRYSEARATLPWSQRTFKEKLAHHADRIFLLFLALFLLVFAGEAAYKMWYVTNWQKVYKFVLDLVSNLISEEEEELNEL